MEKWIVSRNLGRALGRASLALWVSRVEPPARGATNVDALGVAETPTTWGVENDSHAGQFGYSLAAGDVNGDGFCDVVVGARVHPEPHWRGGRAFLFAGAAGGLRVTPVWSAAGTGAEERFGEAVACGDVNGDGFADVLVGSWMHGNRRGAVWLYLGSRDGLATQPAWVVQGETPGLSLGHSVSLAGDVNGDGFGDVVTGAPYYSEGDRREGRVQVFHGGRDGLKPEPDWRYQGRRKATGLGVAVAGGGDVNGDGFDDLLVGEPGYYVRNPKTGHLIATGRVLVFHGGRDGLSDEPDWVFLSPQQFNSSFGRAVSGAGDVNGDGYADVLVGAPKAEEAQREEGKVFLFLGSAAGLATDPAWIARGNVSDGLLGNSLSPAGDVNRDGFADVIVSAIRSTGPGTNRVRAYLFQGGRTGLKLTADWMIELDQAFAMPAITVGAAGDVNGDGYTDVGVAAWLYKSPLNREGYLRVFPGSAAGLVGSSLAPDTPDVAMAWRPRPVLPPWWRSPWAKVAGALSLIAGALAAARRFELQRWRRRLEALEHEHALTRERARIARDMHDHLGATLTRLSLLSELTRRDLGPSERARVHVEQLAAGARELAGAVDEIVWAINPDKDRIENLVSYLCTYTEGFLGSAGLRCRLDLSEDLPELPLTSEARHSVFLACKEALNNVARHARATEVWLRLRVTETALTLSIEDDGCGFSPDSAGDGRCGLANLRRRIETLGGRLRVSSQAGRGTVVWMEVPLKTPR